MLDEFLDYEVQAKHVSKAAHQALRTTYAGEKIQGGFNYVFF